MKLELKETQLTDIRNKLARIMETEEFEFVHEIRAPAEPGIIEAVFAGVIPEVPEVFPDDPYDEEGHTPWIPEVRKELVCRMSYVDWMTIDNINDYIVFKILEQCESEDDAFLFSCKMIDRLAELNAVRKIEVASSPALEQRLKLKYFKLLADRTKEPAEQLIMHQIPCIPDMPQYLWLTVYSIDL
ncbi:TPA: hypothetical protein MM329_000689 [Escherichia coli]|nr:hypothetical protein [Escherichia coli]HBZ8229055.1 hypothetical protein [Escherichia coli]HBZ8345783.1 hypothetical protein [Escherichia coli]HBZ8350852.1 hypothetical protein [Escherichia coli]HBZ8356184.1 hypothetical protein [Escherichia coli]